MNLLQSILTRARKIVSSKSKSVGQSLFTRSVSGVRVNEEVALTYSAVWAAVRVISETIGSLSWHVMEQKGGKSRVIADGDPIDWILHNQPNHEMGPCTFRETIQASALLYGNGYAEIERDRAGRPVWMWPLPPDKVMPVRAADRRIVYLVDDDEGRKTLELRDVFHLKGLGFDGLVGYSPIHMHREAIGMGLAAERFGAAFYGNDSRPGGALVHPSKLSDTARSNLKSEFEGIHRGSSNSWRVAVFEEGLEWKTFSVPQNDAQYIETRKFQINEVARIYRLPLNKLGDWEHAHFNNVEQQNIQFVTDGILPWVCKWEQEANWKLFGRNTMGKRFSKMNVDALLRGDIKTRYDSYAVARTHGWLSANDVRELEDMNPIPNKQNGDLYFVQANMTPSQKALDEPKTPEPIPPTLVQEPDQPDQGDESDPNPIAQMPKAASLRKSETSTEHEPNIVPQRTVEEVRGSFHQIFSDVLRRCVGRERARVPALSTREKMDTFYVEHGLYLVRSLSAPAKVYGDIVGDGPASVRHDAIRGLLLAFVGAWCKQAKHEIRDAQTSNSVGDLCNLWEMSKHGSMATELTHLLTTTCRSTSNGK